MYRASLGLDMGVGSNRRNTLRCKQCAGEREDKHGRCFYCGHGEKRIMDECDPRYRNPFWGPGEVIPVMSLNDNQFLQQIITQQQMNQIVLAKVPGAGW